MLTALVLPRLDARRPLMGALRFAGYLAPVLVTATALGCAPHTSALLIARTLFIAVVGIALAATGRARGGAGLLARAGAGIGILASLYAVWQGCFGFASQARAAQLLPGPLRELILARLGSGRVFGPFLLPASLGGALAMTLPLTIALGVTASGRARLGWSAGVLVQLGALVWTISLGAWIALASAAAIVLALPLARAPKGRSALAAGLVLAALLVAGGWFARSRLLPAPGPQDRPLAYRSGNWSAAAAMIADHPLFGSGPGTFGEVFPAYRREGMNESRFAHNTYLQLVAELGIGVVPFVALVPLGGALLVRRAGAGGAIGIAAGVGAVSFLVHNLVDFTFYQPSVDAIFVLAVAIVYGAAGGQPSSSPDPESARGWSPMHGMVLAASLAAAVFLIFSGLSDLARERAILAHEIGAPTEAGLLDRAIRLDPYDPEPRGDLASVLTSRAAGRPRGSDAAEMLERALDEARRAAALDPRTAFRRNDIARIELMRGHPASAWVELARAATLYPYKAEYRTDLAELEKKLFAAGPAAPSAAPVAAPSASPPPAGDPPASAAPPSRAPEGEAGR